LKILHTQLSGCKKDAAGTYYIVQVFRIMPLSATLPANLIVGERTFKLGNYNIKHGS
jgi:hypothetical protein